MIFIKTQLLPPPIIKTTINFAVEIIDGRALYALVASHSVSFSPCPVMDWSGKKLIYAALSLRLHLIHVNGLIALFD